MVHDKGWVLPFVLPFEAVVQACCNPPSRPPGPRRLCLHRPPHRRRHQLAVIAAAAAVGGPRQRRLLQTWVGFGAGTEAAEVDAASRQLTAAPRSTVGRQPAPPPTGCSRGSLPTAVVMRPALPPAPPAPPPRRIAGTAAAERRAASGCGKAAEGDSCDDDCEATVEQHHVCLSTAIVTVPRATRVASAAAAAAAAFQWASSMAKGVLASECTGQGPGRSRGCRSRRALRRPRRWCSCQCRCI